MDALGVIVARARIVDWLISCLLHLYLRQLVAWQAQLLIGYLKASRDGAHELCWLFSRLRQVIKLKWLNSALQLALRLVLGLGNRPRRLNNFWVQHNLP